jgi:hypothetical protein
MNAVGISLAPRDQPVWPLLREGLMRFDTWHHQSRGYFHFIAPQFESYAQRDAHIGIESLNVLFCLRGQDLQDSLKVCSDLDRQLDGLPNGWRPFLGTERRPNEPERKIEPLLFKRRARQIVAHLRALLLRAEELDGAVVYGNGVLYRPLCNIPPTPGVVTYS